MSGQQPKKNYRTIGKIRNQNGKNGNFQKFLVENPSPTKQDQQGNIVNDHYHKGVLLWCDAETQKIYQVKQAKIGKVTDGQYQAGFTASLYIDLDSEYDVTLQNQ